MNGVDLIVAERQRQIDVEGYDEEHDRGHADQLATAAACYALPREGRKIHHLSSLIELRVQLWRLLWPWTEKAWKPTPEDRIRELVKAGALIAAAIDAEASDDHPS